MKVISYEVRKQSTHVRNGAANDCSVQLYNCRGYFTLLVPCSYFGGRHQQDDEDDDDDENKSYKHQIKHDRNLECVSEIRKEFLLFFANC